MRKIGFAKYKQTTKEILPKTYKVNEITCQRKMFCTMINQYLSAQSQFNLNDEKLFEKSLLHIFEAKILSFFQFDKFKPQKSQPIVKIFTYDSLLINQYFKQSTHPKMQYFSKNIHFNPKFKMLFGYVHPTTDLIQLIFNGKEVEMMLDLNEIFTRTVYSRIKKEIGKSVTLDDQFIHITQKGVTTRLYPRWKHINPNNLKLRRSDIDDGLEQLQNKECDQYYLVYPKTEEFKRHISVKGESQELKMIPYSFTFINRKERRCQK
ncbi:MAG TPA: hypothetical protein EYP79_02270 [Campylobacterales bacterium]|nr:hypothetical protein [Campylobacterales bacterium]